MAADLEIDDHAGGTCDELVHLENAVADLHNTMGWTRAQVVR